LLVEINKRIGYKLAATAGAKGLAGLGKLVPLVGGPIGAGVDALSCRTIATYARHAFPPHMSVGHPVVDGEIVPRP
jgi:hypothetical protein